MIVMLLNVMLTVPFIILSFLCVHFIQGADLNVGTTLFTKADTYRECWSSENLALLTSRMILEDLLPSTTILTVDSNEFVGNLVEYFRLILEIVRQKTNGKIKHITLIALTDLLGGYLHHAVLPTAKNSYYAGMIDYDSMQSLLGLFEELKWFLRTNGQGWAKPMTQNCENLEIQRLKLQCSGHSDAHICDDILFFSSGDTQNAPCDITIPLPFFDSISKPSAIALPSKHCPLHNVEANSSAYIVMSFFIVSYKCLQSKNVKPETMDKFTRGFGSWIDRQIMPRLQDEKFYAAFGGILRVKSTLKRLQSNHPSYIEKEVNDMSHLGEDKGAGERAKVTGVTECPAKEANDESKSTIILTAVLIVIFVWFLLGSSFVCYRIRAKKKSNPDDSKCNTDTTSTLKSSKYFYPTPPKSDYKGTSSGETERTSTSTSDRGRKKSRFMPNMDKFSHSSTAQPQSLTMTIKTVRGLDGCRCGDTAIPDNDQNGTRAIIDTDHTEKRLPSIPEMSEKSMSNRGNTRNDDEYMGRRVAYPKDFSGEETSPTTSKGSQDNYGQRTTMVMGGVHYSKCGEECADVCVDGCACMGELSSTSETSN